MKNQDRRTPLLERPVPEWVPDPHRLRAHLVGALVGSAIAVAMGVLS